MKIIRSYILKEFFSVSVFSFLILSLVMLTGNLMKISDMIVRKGVSFIDAAKIFLFFTPYLVSFTVPLAFLLGVLLVMGRLIADNEIIALRAAGISLTRILKIFLIVGVAFSLLMFILNDKVIPNFHYRYRSQIKNIYFKNVSALIEPGIFLENFQNYVIYVSDKNENKLKNIFIYEVEENKKTSKVTFAKQGEFITEGDTLEIKLEDGFRDEVSASNKNELYRLNFKIFFMDIPIKKTEEVKLDKKPSDMTLRELHLRIQHLNKMGIDAAMLKGEFHKRISFSLAVMTFMILGFGVSLAVKHREKSVNFILALLSAGIYYLLFIFGEALIEYHQIIPSLGMWLPNIFITLTGLYLFSKHAYPR